MRRMPTSAVSANVSWFIFPLLALTISSKYDSLFSSLLPFVRPPKRERERTCSSVFVRAVCFPFVSSSSFSKWNVSGRACCWCSLLQRLNYISTPMMQWGTRPRCQSDVATSANEPRDSYLQQLPLYENKMEESITFPWLDSFRAPMQFIYLKGLIINMS